MRPFKAVLSLCLLGLVSCDFAARSLLQNSRASSSSASRLADDMDHSESRGFDSFDIPRSGRQSAGDDFGGFGGGGDFGGGFGGNFADNFDYQKERPRERQQEYGGFPPQYDYKRPQPQRETPPSYDRFDSPRAAPQRPRGYDRPQPVQPRSRPQQNQQQPQLQQQQEQPQRQQQRRRILRKKPEVAAEADRPYRRVDTERQAVISDVVSPSPSSPSVYKPASGPAYATATNIDELGVAQARIDPLSYVDGGADVPAEQRSIQEAVFGGANGFTPDGVYQKEDRLEFQIHGHQGPHSYRYGYDTGNGYNRQFRYEERDKDGYVKGRYGFFDRYGKLQIVNYSADPYKGFHAEGAHVPKYPH